MTATSSLSVVHGASGSTQQQQPQNKQLIAQLAIDPDTWTSDMDIDFGQQEI